MAALTRRALAEGPVAQAARALLRCYAAVLFSRSPLCGALLLCATATVPGALLGGLLGVGAGLATARLFGLDRDALSDGSYGISPLLLGLGVSQTLGLSAGPLCILVVLAAVCVLLTAALRSALSSKNLPALSVPFLIVYYLWLGAAPLLGLQFHPLPLDGATWLSAVSPVLADVLCSIGSLLFLPRVDAGALFLLALFIHSRIAALLAGIAALTVLALPRLWPALAGSEALPVLMFNSVYTAIAIGGVWFVPSPASIALAELAVFLCALVCLGGLGLFSRIGLPILFLPFNATVLTLLLAARQRAWDRGPKSVDFTPGTPEENLAYFRTRLLRFRWLYPIRFRLPVRGAWVCTQGTDGALSHKGRWRHAFDLEVKGSDGRLFTGEGAALKDYCCYRLPVLASAAGVVVKVESAVPDNESGVMNLEQNWGNYVIVQHAPGLYSMVAHLVRGSIKVVEGQSVQAGQVLGLCGNSGRSARPHVHFQLQSGSRPADDTLPCRFTDAVVHDPGQGDVERVVPDLCPVEGQVVRNLEHDEDLAGFFGFSYRTVQPCRIGQDPAPLESDIDVSGQQLVRDTAHDAHLYYSLSDGFFTLYDSAGTSSPALQILRAALSRVPLDPSPALRWTDYLPARPFRGAAARLLSDLIAPFLQRDGIEMEYRMQSESGRLIVRGESRLRWRSEPLLVTRAELVRGEGLQSASITLRGRTWTLQRDSGLVAASTGSPRPQPVPSA
jgi:murein DD-endopeptidase MepM/ murein hydrolase activator NlpD/urea transporter